MFKVILGKYSKNIITTKTQLIKAYPFENILNAISNQFGFFQVRTFNQEDLSSAEKFIITNYIIITEEDYECLTKNEKGETV